MRIAYLVVKETWSLNDESGYATHTRELRNAMIEKGHEVVVYMGVPDKLSVPLTQETNRKSLKSNIKKVIPDYVWRGMRDLKESMFDRKFFNIYFEKIKKFNPDIIYERSTLYHSVALRIAKKLKKPLVLEYNAPLTEERRINGKTPLEFYGNYVERKMIKASSGVIAGSTPLKKYLIAKGFDGNNIIVVTVAANLTEGQCNKKAIAGIKKKYNIEDKKIIGYVGRFFYWHCLDILVEVATTLKKTYNNIHFLLVGDGESRNLLQEQVEAKGLSDFFTITGLVDKTEVPKYINTFDIAILPGCPDYGVPSKLFEYAVANKPIIAPNTDAIRDKMKHEADGLLFKSGSAVELENALVNCLDNPESATERAKAFRVKTLEKFTWANSAEDSISFFEKILNQEKLQKKNLAL